ncbi:MAG: arginine--tRNA ligase [Flavobacteriales bacterium]|nr:arginine--tRNA ligase [Flavobacteriales bacterium]
MRIENHLAEKAKAAVLALFNEEVGEGAIQVQRTRKEFEGDVTLVVFPLSRMAKMKPEETGEVLGKWLCDHVEEFVRFNVVKGFLNIVVADDFWIKSFTEAYKNERYGLAPAASKGKVMVEYSSPNTNKPLHLGHLRNNFLGYAVSQILEAAGYEVVKVQIINDRGIHICKSMLAWLRFGEGETPESSGLKGDKLVGKYYVRFDQAYKAEIAELMSQGKSEDEAKKEAPIMLAAQDMLLKWEAKDPEVYALWEKMNAWVYAGFEATYKEMGVAFDQLYYESNTYLKGKEVVQDGLDKGVFYKREDGSVWCDLREDGLDEKLVLRKDGTAVYMTQDIGTAILRFEDNPGLQFQVYTVGNEQEYHFKVLFMILEKLGFENAKLNYHLSYGMVELPEGKMKSREGTVVDADDLLAEMAQAAEDIAKEQGKMSGLTADEQTATYKMVGYGALKYFLLKVDPKKSMMFDPKESIDFLGNTGPFIQFNYVRTLALLRKFDDVIEPNFELDVLSDGEKALIKKIYGFPEVIEEAASQYDPSQIANYCFELAKEFSSFYQNSPIMNEENKALKNMRLALSSKTGDVIKTGMNLLGIQMPERM